MSYVADIVLLTTIDDGGMDDEHPNTDRLEAWLREHYSDHVRLVKVDQHAVGTKAMQCDVFITAINYLDTEAFVEVFRTVPWDMPECVQLLIKNEHDDRFTVYLPERTTTEP
jgi:hypothetical protein